MIRWGRLLRWIVFIGIVGGGGIAMVTWAAVTWPPNVSTVDEYGIIRSRDEMTRLNSERIQSSLQFTLLITGFALIAFAMFVACMLSCCAERFVSELRPSQSFTLREVRIHPIPEVFLSTQVSPSERPTLVVTVGA